MGDAAAVIGKINSMRIKNLAFVILNSPLARGVLLTMCALFTLFCESPHSQAQTFFGAGTEALGRAGRAANVAQDAQFLNPAALSFAKDSNGGLAFQTSGITSATPVNGYAAVITDNDPEKFAAGGVGYVYRRSSFPDHIVTDQDISLDIAAKIVPTISLGVQTHTLFRQNTGAPGFTKYNATAGLMILPKPFLGFSLVFYDMFNDPDLQLIPTTAIGTHIIIMDIMRIRADITQPQFLNPNNGGTLNVGMELDGGSGFLFRFGGDWDTVNVKTYWTAGISWEGPRLNVAYAFRNDVAVSNNSTQTFQAWLSF
jgi:hypothetical protein